MFQPARAGSFLLLRFFSIALFVLVADRCGAEAAGRPADPDTARQILEATGVRGGLIVHLGCGDGKLTAALAAGDNCLVQGLDTNADNVRQAQSQIRKRGIYGRATAERFDGKHLPYADNLVNLVVGDDLGGVATTEAIRVLAPGGSLYVKQAGRWTRTVKPRPENIDDWTHYLHDASGNPVAHDEVVGPPGRLQWVAEPRYTRSHEYTPSISSLVCSGGSIFYIADEGSIASIKRAPEWRLIARDAFNGIVLWKKPLDGAWFPHIVNWGQTPRQLQRKLVAVGDRVYVTLGLHSPLTAMDATTGEVLKVYEHTRGTEEIVFHQGILLLFVRSVTQERTAELEKWSQLVARRGSPVDDRDSAAPLVKRLRATEAQGDKAVLAIQADSGRLLWKKTGENVSGLRTYSLCAEGRRVFHQNRNVVVCRDLNTGEALWSKSAPPLRMVSGGTVYCANGKTITALSAETGEVRWTKTPELCDVRDVFVAGGSLWLGGFKPWHGEKAAKRGPAWGPYFATQRDPATGEVLMRVTPDNPGHHHRCYQNKATDRFILGGRRGTEFIDLDSGDVLWNSWARGVCRYGVMPANGLLYAPPHACACYVGAKLVGFNALAPRLAKPGVEEPKSASVEKGPAYAQPTSNPQSPASSPSSWPTHRHDAGRSGSTRASVAPVLGLRWQVDLGGPITAATVSDGRVYVASVEDHRLCAVDADSGQPAWHFTAGARVDSPPTVYRGRAIFGCRDGCVYSLRTADGALAWRLKTPRADRRVVVNGQLESVSPVHGSVLVDRDVVAFTAGRSSYLDGGIDLYRIEPGSGKTLSKTKIYSPDPVSGRQPDHSAPAVMPGARMDLLTSDARYVYLRDMVFDREGNRQSESAPHLFTLTGFLDNAWAHRSYWIFGTECSISTGCSGRARDLVYGRLIVYDDSTIFGYGRQAVDWSNQLKDGPYRLFALKRGERQPWKEPLWKKPLPVQVRAMLLAGKVLFVAGSPVSPTDWLSEPDENPKGVLAAVSATDGTLLAQTPLDAPPIFDGMAAAAGRLYISLENGHLVSMDGKSNE